MRPTSSRIVPVRLTRKLANVIDGVDLSRRKVGQRLPLEKHEARLLLAEGWAEPVPECERRATASAEPAPKADPEDVKSRDTER